MAAPGSWTSIKKHGLLSTAALLDLFEVTDADRESLRRRRHHSSVRVTHPTHGVAVIRDQKALHDSMLAKCLRGRASVDEWRRLLDSRVFFWVDESRLRRLRDAREYRADRQTVILVDTRKLVERYGPRIRLAPMNTGATRSVTHFRDLDTFTSIENYSRLKVVELTLDHAVPDIAELVVRVEEVGGSIPDCVIVK